MPVFNIRSIFFIDTDNGYGVGASGLLIKTINGGTGWTEPAGTGGTSNQLNSVYLINVDTFYAVARGGVIQKTTNGGVNWTAQTSGTTQHFNSVYFLDTNNGFAVGAGGTILNTTNGGTTWTAQTSGITTALNSCYFIDTSNGYAAGDSGVILKTTNGGTTWNTLASGTTSALFGIYYTASNVVTTEPYGGGSYTEFLGATEKEPFKVGSTLLISTSAGQLETPTTITHRNAQGQSTNRPFVPTIDPFQILTDRVEDTTEYMFDGGTRLRVSTLNANASLEVRLYPADIFNPSNMVGIEGNPANTTLKLPKRMYVVSLEQNSILSYGKRYSASCDLPDKKNAIIAGLIISALIITTIYFLSLPKKI